MVASAAYAYLYFESFLLDYLTVDCFNNLFSFVFNYYLLPDGEKQFNEDKDRVPALRAVESLQNHERQQC